MMKSIAPALLKRRLHQSDVLIRLAELRRDVAVQALAERESLDLAACSAYSDSANDLPMLSLVGDPCAINPDHRLRHHARENGWRIHDYRTGRKAARAGLVLGSATTGAAVAASLVRRQVRRRG